MLFSLLAGIIHTCRQVSTGPSDMGTGGGAVVCPAERVECPAAATTGNTEKVV